MSIVRILWISRIGMRTPLIFLMEHLMTSVFFNESSAMTQARNLFGTRTDQAIVKDEVTSPASRDPYEAIRRASERMNAGQTVFALGENQAPQRDEQDVRRHAGLLSAI